RPPAQPLVPAATQKPLRLAAASEPSFAEGALPYAGNCCQPQGGFMRKVSSGIRRGAAALAIAVLLSVPTAFADDGHIQPPLPQAPSFWHVVLFVVTHARVLPFVG